MQRTTARLRQLLASNDFLYWPSLYYPLAGRVAEQIGIESAYIGGYVTGGSLAVSETLLTMDEQVHAAGQVARARAPSRLLLTQAPALLNRCTLCAPFGSSSTRASLEYILRISCIPNAPIITSA